MSRAHLPKSFLTTCLLFAFLLPAGATGADVDPAQEVETKEAAPVEERAPVEDSISVEEVPATTAATPTATAASDPATEVRQPGLRAFLDPETGELSEEPTAEQALWLETEGLSPLNKSTIGLEPFTLQGGGRGVNISDRFRSALTVQRMPDGSLAVRCTDHPDQPAAHSHTPASAPQEQAPTETAPVQ